MAKEKISPAVLGTSPTGGWIGKGRVSPESRLTYGAELAKRLGEGIANRVPAEYIRETRDRVSEACEELLSVGARIRPLMVDGKQKGWVRGVHDTERRLLKRWVPDKNDFIFRCLRLATTLEERELESMSYLEAYRLVRLVVAMGDRDASLYPYLSAYSTTSGSEALWHSGGACLSSERRVVLMPDGDGMTVLMPSDHARLWASLCVYREQAKKRLDESWNAAMLLRAWAGKSVDALSEQLKTATKQMRANALEPWERVVKAPEDKSLDDGWAHLENMETKEGMLKELHGMLSHDRHERLMEKIEKQQIEEAEQRRRDIEAMIAKRAESRTEDEERVTILTEDDLRKKEAELKKGRVSVVPVSRERADPSPVDVREKLKRYQQEK